MSLPLLENLRKLIFLFAAHIIILVHLRCTKKNSTYHVTQLLRDTTEPRTAVHRLHTLGSSRLNV